MKLVNRACALIWCISVITVSVGRPSVAQTAQLFSTRAIPAKRLITFSPIQLPGTTLAAK